MRLGTQVRAPDCAAQVQILIPPPTTQVTLNSTSSLTLGVLFHKMEKRKHLLHQRLCVEKHLAPWLYSIDGKAG